MDRALFLISEGEMTKAVSLLISRGLADAGDPRIQAQLRSKHPARKEALPGRLDHLGEFARVQVSLEGTIRGLSNHAGTGASGYRNEYLKALVTDFADARARTVLPLLDEFATAYANADLPAWFYYVFTAIKSMAPVKTPAATPEDVPDVRPIGVGECLRKAMRSAVVVQHKPLLGEHLWPQQVALGVPAGLSILIFGVRFLLEAHPDWAVVRLDLRNAFNEIKRKVLVERLAGTEHLRALVPILWATCSPESEVFLPGPAGLEKADFQSAEGGQQGDGLSSAFAGGAFGRHNQRGRPSPGVHGSSGRGPVRGGA